MNPRQRKDYSKLLRHLLYSAPHEYPPLSESLRLKLARIRAITIVQVDGRPRSRLTGLGTAVALESVAAMLQRNGLSHLALQVSATAMDIEQRYLNTEGPTHVSTE